MQRLTKGRVVFMQLHVVLTDLLRTTLQAATAVVPTLVAAILRTDQNLHLTIALVGIILLILFLIIFPISYVIGTIPTGRPVAPLSVPILVLGTRPSGGAINATLQTSLFRPIESGVALQQLLVGLDREPRRPRLLGPAARRGHWITPSVGELRGLVLEHRHRPQPVFRPLRRGRIHHLRRHPSVTPSPAHEATHERSPGDHNLFFDVRRRWSSNEIPAVRPPAIARIRRPPATGFRRSPPPAVSDDRRNPVTAMDSGDRQNPAGGGSFRRLPESGRRRQFPTIAGIRPTAAVSSDRRRPGLRRSPAAARFRQPPAAETEVLKCWEHHRSLGAWPVDPRIIEYVHRSGLFHLTQVQWIRLDWPLITVLVERWRSETHTFHLRHGEMSITLQDVAILMGLPIDGDVVVGNTTLDWTDVCMTLLSDVPDMMKRGSVKLSWLRERFTVIAKDASAEVVRRHARAYLLHLLGCTIFNDKTGNSVPLMYLPLLEDLDRVSRYSWGGATLGYLYRQLSIACKSDAKAICGSLTLLQLWSWERLHVGRPDITMHPLAQDMPLGHRSKLDHQEDYQMWHRRTDYIIPPDEKSVGIGRVEYMAWYWSITRWYIGRPGFTYDMRYESRDHIERSLMYIDGVLSHVQRTYSSTSHAGPSEPCADTPQQPDDAGPSHCSPDVMTVSQYGLYDVGASQILTDEGMTDTQPPQSTVGTYRRQRRHRGSTSTLPQQSQSDLLGETLGSISEDMDFETAQSESCHAILVHETQSQSETEVDVQEQCHSRSRGRASRKGKKR
ncbi:hypothetical protein Taro_017271, partial [Colocasia esculenta]|nr:hypothetical protein [Colocasia esculenta]